jgi:hypothetical protein
MTETEKAREIAEIVQKVYLGVGPVLSQEEARDILRRAGAELGEDLPAPTQPEEAA